MRDDCFPNGKKPEKLLQTTLLFILMEGSGHGYWLGEKLRDFGFQEDEVNVSTLYRNLRKMEKEGYIESTWEEGDHGPAKRVYTLTGMGLESIDSRADHLRERIARIEGLLDHYSRFNNHREGRE
ncbi:MAG: PadR family transcriptional regulator [Bacillota bacterium]